MALSPLSVALRVRTVVNEPEQALQVVDVGEFDLDSAPPRTDVDVHTRGEIRREALLQLEHSGGEIGSFDP